MQDKAYPDVPPDFGNWLAGFIDGEGCFSIEHITRPGRSLSCYACKLSVRLRNDDLPILEEIHERTGLGSIVNYRLPTKQVWDSKPVSLWQVFTKRDCTHLIALFDRYPLRAKKARDYAIWRQGVFAWAEVQRGNLAQSGRNTSAWARMATIRQQLKDVRVYVEPHLLEEGKMDAIPNLDHLVGGKGIAAA